VFPRTKVNFYALEIAASEGHEEAVTLLLDRGADVNLGNSDGETALINAVSQGHTDIRQLLLERGANINATNYSGCTAFHNACFRGNLDCVAALMRAGCDTSLRFDTKNGESRETCHDCAKDEGHTDVLRRIDEV
jgi:ankyrin repeat protein